MVNTLWLLERAACNDGPVISVWPIAKPTRARGLWCHRLGGERHVRYPERCDLDPSGRRDDRVSSWPGGGHKPRLRTSRIGENEPTPGSVDRQLLVGAMIFTPTYLGHNASTSFKRYVGGPLN